MFLRETLTDDSSTAGLSSHSDFLMAGTANTLRRLVILGSSDTALALVRDARLHGLEALVFDMDDGPAMFSRYATAQRASRPTRSGDRPSLVRELRELGDPRHTALIATSDDWLRRVMAVRAQLNDAYQALLLPADDTLELCLDKMRFTQWCREQGLPHARSWCAGLEDRPEGLTAPFIIRPALARHGIREDVLPKAAFAQDEAQLADWLARFSHANAMAVVAESLLERPIRQFSVGFARRPGRFLGFVTEKIRPRAHACGVGSFVSLRDEPAILAMGKDIAERLDFFGIGEVELLVDGSTGERFVVEVNARPWLQFSMAAASGHDLLHVITGVRAKGLPRGHSMGLHWWAPMPDVLNLLSDRPEGWTGAARTAVRLGRAVARANIYARFDWSDPAPAWPRKRSP